MDPSKEKGPLLNCKNNSSQKLMNISKTYIFSLFLGFLLQQNVILLNKIT